MSTTSASHPRVIAGKGTDLGSAPARTPFATDRRRSAVWRRVLHLVAVLAVVLTPLTVAAGHVLSTDDGSVASWVWTHAGPDYPHTLADRQAEAVCMAGPASDADACQARVAVDDAAGRWRFPAPEGGPCPLASRFECARAYGLPTWDRDVPWWAPWWLQNGPAALALNGVGGALLAVLLAAFSGAARTRRARVLRLTRAALVGVAAGGVWLSLSRHSGIGDPAAEAGRWLSVLGGAAVAACALTAAVTAAVTDLRARRAARHHNRHGGAR